MEKARYIKDASKAGYTRHLKYVEAIKDDEITRCNNRLGDAKDQNN